MRPIAQDLRWKEEVRAPNCSSGGVVLETADWGHGDFPGELPVSCHQHVMASWPLDGIRSMRSSTQHSRGQLQRQQLPGVSSAASFPAAGPTASSSSPSNDCASLSLCIKCFLPNLLGNAPTTGWTEGWTNRLKCDKASTVKC